ncbi:hypothetical protein [Vampirovibrio sp.]|uniref:hypothetical protein n=1 Tax=Vampirovibrio sp. TaxID=2717857 RepID=UPI00359422BB
MAALSQANASTSNAAPGQLDTMSLIIPIFQLLKQVIELMLAGQSASVAEPAASAGPSTGAPVGGAGNATEPKTTASTTNSAQPASSAGGSVAVASGTDDDPKALKPASQSAEAPSGESAVGSADTMTIDERRDLNYSDLKADPKGGKDYKNVRGGKEAFNGVSGKDAAIMHLAGRGHISAGTSKNGVSGSARIYNNVLNNPENFTPDETKLIEGYAAAEKEKYGYFTGEGLDHDFADQMAARGDISPDKLAKYHQAIDARVAKMVNNPNQAAVKKEAGQAVNITSDIGTLQEQSGLSRYEQAVYRLSGHATLFSGDGSIDGDILAVTLGNEKSLDGRKFGDQDTNIDPETLSLLQDDMAIDGKLNGDALRTANEGVLDKIFMGGPEVTAEGIRKTSVKKAEATGRNQQDIMQNLQLSANDAIKQFGSFAKEHPVMTAVGVGAMAAGAAICPFLGGTMAVGAGIAAGSKMFSEEAKPAAY